DQMRGQMEEQAPELLDVEPRDDIRVGAHTPAAIDGDRAGAGLRADRAGEDGAREVRHPRGSPQASGGDVAHHRSSPAARSSGATALTWSGIGAPGGQQRASMRAAAAATSGADAPARPNARQPRAQRSADGSAATAAAIEDSAAYARSPRSGKTKLSGSA